MMNRLSTYYIIERTLFSLLLILLSGSLFAQARLIATASETEIGKNEYVEIQFIVENANNVKQITPPVFRNFNVVSGPNQQSGMSNVNGDIKRYVGIGYVLKPKATGKFTIPVAFANADGRDLRSNPVTIIVNNSSQGTSGGNSFTSPFAGLNLDEPAETKIHEYDDYILRKGDNLDDKIRKNIFVKVDVNRNSCFVGEPIVATYKLFTRLKSESNLTKSPSLNGFSVSELGTPGDLSVTTQKYNGREYSVYTLRKVQLYPLQAGNIELDPAVVENKITFIKAEYAANRNGDVFYDMLRDFANASTPPEALLQRTITLNSDPLMITVKPLPESNKPENFKGAVGDFKIQMSLENSHLTTDDAGSLRLIIAGEGNLQMINAPKISWPAGIEGFDSKTSANISKSAVPMRGEKVFTYPFTIEKPGTYIIPGVIFSYFDPSIKNYKEIHTREFNITVDRGTGIKPAIGNNATLISSTPEFTQKMSDNWWVFVAGGVICLLLAGWFIRNAREQKIGTKENTVTNSLPPNFEPFPDIPKNYFAEAQQKLHEGKADEFYQTLHVELLNYLSDKLLIPVEELNKKKINETLDKNNVGVNTTVLLGSLLDDLETNLYTPMKTTGNMEDDYDRAGELVSLLNKQMS